MAEDTVTASWSWLKRTGEEKSDQPESAIQSQNRTAWLLGTFQFLLLICFACFASANTSSPIGNYGYNMFIGVEIMMFVGFGYLMTFLKWYGLGAVGLTMVITAMGIQYVLFTESFWYQVVGNKDWMQVDVNIYTLLQSLYAVSAVLISFGAVIGKITPLSLVVMTVIELFLHGFNYKVLMDHWFELSDIGGTYIDHMFGAYFGLAVAYMLGKPKGEAEGGTIPDVFSLIGTSFLWVYWPSFVAGAAEPNSDQQQRAIVNTIIALAASTVTTFWATLILGDVKKFRACDIQNATLAGGVAIGAVANLNISLFTAALVGAIAGLVSSYGYNVIQPYLEEKWNIHDTCGVHNLHAMPSVIGGIFSVIVAFYNDNGDIYANPSEQWWRQLLGMIVCTLFAIFAGLITGKILNAITIADSDRTDFNDKLWWSVEADFEPSLNYSTVAKEEGEVELADVEIDKQV
jgi:ammonium transporter Rh